MRALTVLKIGAPVALLMIGALGLVALSRSKTLPTPSAAIPQAAEQQTSAPTSVVKTSPPDRASASVSPATLATTLEVKTGVAPKFNYGRELTEFANLRAKVFLSPGEKLERKKLLANTVLLRSLEPILKFPAAVGTDLGQLQNQAIDLLLEAKAQGDVAAGEVLRSVIEDKTIENEAANPSDRRLLAGLKAEILFQWSALEPARASDIERWLPGPVSQRIWENVRAAQTQNFAESALTAQTASDLKDSSEH